VREEGGSAQALRYRESHRNLTGVNLMALMALAHEKTAP